MCCILQFNIKQLCEFDLYNNKKIHEIIFDITADVFAKNVRLGKVAVLPDTMFHRCHDNFPFNIVFSHRKDMFLSGFYMTENCHFSTFEINY